MARTEEARLLEAAEAVVKAFRLTERMTVEVVRSSRTTFSVTLVVRLTEVDFLRTDLPVDLSEAEDEDEARMLWADGIIAIFISAARRIGLLSEQEEYGFGRKDAEAPWCFKQYPVMDLDDMEDGVPVLFAGEVPDGTFVAEIGDFPASDDMEGWKGVIRAIGRAIFGFYGYLC